MIEPLPSLFSLRQDSQSIERLYRARQLRCFLSLLSAEVKHLPRDVRRSEPVLVRPSVWQQGAIAIPEASLALEKGRLGLVFFPPVPCEPLASVSRGAHLVFCLSGGNCLQSGGPTIEISSTSTLVEKSIL